MHHQGVSRVSNLHCWLDLIAVCMFLLLLIAGSARIQRPFGHDCRSQIKVYGSWIWWNCLKLNIKRNIASETPTNPVLWQSLFMLVSQTCRNPPSMLICLPLAHPPQRRVQQKPVPTRPLQPAFGSEGFSCSLSSSWTINGSRNMHIAIKSSQQWQVRHSWHPLMMHHSSNLWITHS